MSMRKGAKRVPPQLVARHRLIDEFDTEAERIRDEYRKIRSNKEYYRYLIEENASKVANMAQDGNGKLSEAIGKFLKKKKDIMSHYTPPFETAENHLKVESYALINRFLSQTGGGNVIKNMVNTRNRKQKGNGIPESPSFNENPFHWGLLAIDPERDAYPRAKISLYAPLLHYAYLHRVPPAYLVGFLLQHGNPSEIRRKYNNGIREKRFEELQNRQIFSDPCPICVKRAREEEAAAKC